MDFPSSAKPDQAPKDMRDRPDSMVERRRNKRFPLRCTVQFEGDHPMAGTTVDISSHGFYCLVGKPLSPGDERRCLVDLMSGHSDPSQPRVSLNCDVVVLRHEERAEGSGIACWIRNYTVVKTTATRSRGRTGRRVAAQ